MRILPTALRHSGVRMSIHSLRQRSVRILLALSLGLGLAALHTGCASNPGSYKDPAPAISSFLACKDNTFALPDPTKPGPPKTGTTISIVSGSSIYLRGTFAMTGGTAVITPGNLSVTTNVPVPMGPITTPTTYTLKVINAKGDAVTSQVNIAIPGPADATITTSADPASSVTIGTTGLTASVPAQAGCTYKWSITGGTAVSATTANTFSFTAGNTVGSTLQLSCEVKNAAETPTTGTRSFTLKDTAPTSLTFSPASVSLFNTVPMAGAAVPVLQGSTQPGMSSFALAPTSDSLPIGLSLSSTTGAISGTPNELASLPHTYNVIVRATNSGGFVDGTLSILVNPAPAFSLSSPTSAGTPVGPGATVVLTWSVNPSVTSFTITPSVQTTPYVPSTSTGTFNVTAPAATQVYTMTVQPGDFTTTATVHVDAGDITIGTFGPAVVPFGSTQAPITWSITSGVPVTQFLKDPAGTKISGDLSGAARSFTVTNLLPRRQAYTLTAQNDLKTATMTGFVAQRGLYHVAGSYGSGTGTMEGDPDADGISTARFYRTQGMIVSEFPGDNGAIIAVDYSANTIRHIGGTDRKVRTIAGMAGLTTSTALARTETQVLRTPRQATIDPATGDIYVGGESFTTGYSRFLKLSRVAYATYTPSLFEVTLSGAAFIPNANAFAIHNGTIYFVDFTAKKLFSASLATGVMTQLLDLGTTGLNLTAGPAAMAKSISSAAGNAHSYLFLTDTGGSGATAYSKVIRINLDLFNPDGSAKPTPAPAAAVYGGTTGVGPTATGFVDHLTATSGKFLYAQGITADAKGNVYIADRDNAAIRMIPAGGSAYSGALITVVGKAGGTATPGYMNAAQSLDGTLPAAANTSASLAYPYAVTVTPDGSTLYVGDAALNNVQNVQSVHRVAITNMDANGFPQNGTTFTMDDPSRQAYVFAGGPRIHGLQNGVGSMAQFRFTSQTTTANTTGANLAVLPDGSRTFVADTLNNLVRVIAADGMVTTLKNSASADLVFFAPKGIAVQVDATGALSALFVADTGTTKKIRRFTPDSGVPTFTEDLAFALTGTYPASLNVQGMTVDGTNLYFTDFTANNVYKVDLAAGNATTIFVTGGGGNPTGITIQPGGTGYVWVAFTGTNQVKQFGMDGSAGAVVGLAAGGFLDGAATTVAALKNPIGLCADGNGFIFVTDTGNNALRAIDTVNNLVITHLGAPTSTTTANYYGQRMGLLNSDRSSGDPANLTGGNVFAPQGMAINSKGDLTLTSANSVFLLVAPANK